MLNWKVRIKNKTFWMTFIPAICLLIQVVGGVFEINIDVGTIGHKLVEVVNALFAVLMIMGVVNDPTTTGVRDSKQALGYDKPRKEND